MVIILFIFIEDLKTDIIIRLMCETQSFKIRSIREKKIGKVKIESYQIKG
ncbi:hypothetical protein D1AOALGA4SA_8294 [Olavius algarvensis Delta 1 endosymbiont]|nr:hypothetical protein D1AOALGA4SA_8294 [Olavius algarvensis Delta 1 endosymbiont]